MSDEAQAGMQTALTSLEGAILLNQALEARSMHVLWMKRGRSFLDGTPIDFSPEFAQRDDMCPIGSWLSDRIEPRLKQLDLFARTDLLHAEFHLALGGLFREEHPKISSAVIAEFQRTGDALTQCIEDWIALARSRR